LRGTAPWLTSTSDVIRFRVDDLHSAVLGIAMNKGLYVPVVRRVTFGPGVVGNPVDLNSLNCESSTVTVRLTNDNTGEFYCEARFEIVTNPASISALQ